MVSRETYEAYTASLDQQYAEACQLVADYIDSFDWLVDYETRKAQRNAVIAYIHQVLDVYCDVANFLAGEFYAKMAEGEGVDVPETEIPDKPGLEQVASSVRYAARDLWGGTVDADGFRAKCMASVKRYVKKAASDTIVANCRRDGRAGKGIRWARVPRGGETCPFCIMLASRGFVYYTQQSANLFDHDHVNCDCDIIASFEGDIEGYDPSIYLGIYNYNVAYDRYGHVDTQQTLANMREVYYEENKDRWNAMRRERYARQHPKE